MQLYTEPSANVSRRAWPGRGMVVDPGLHLFGSARVLTARGLNGEMQERARRNLDTYPPLDSINP